MCGEDWKMLRERWKNSELGQKEMTQLERRKANSFLLTDFTDQHHHHGMVWAGSTLKVI